MIYIGNNPIKNLKQGNSNIKRIYLGSQKLWADQSIIYGFHIDPSISDPARAVTYLADAVGKTPAAMGTSSFSYGDWADAFFMPKPCMLRSDGTVAYYLDPNDYTKKADGTASDVANTSFAGNAMMEWPLIWYKFEAGAQDGEGYFYCSDQQVDESYHCWCNYDCDDNIIPHFYTAIYDGTLINGKMRSLSGLNMSSYGVTGRTMTDVSSLAAANNSTSKAEWNIDVFSDKTLILALSFLMFKSINLRTSLGAGLQDNTVVTSYTTGSVNDKGLFYGTGDRSSASKLFGMENWVGYTYHWIAGCVSNSQYEVGIKLTYGKADGTNVIGYNTDGTWYKVDNDAVIPGNTGRITKMWFTNNAFYPREAVSGLDLSLYYGFSSSRQSGSQTVCLAGGNGTEFAMYPAAFQTQVFGAGLSCKPVATE